MTPERVSSLARRYAPLRVAVVGDFFLDRYLVIDPAKAETSIETGLPVHNVVSVRAQPGAAGTVINNLVALGVGAILPVGFLGDDGEGYELRRALGSLPGVCLDHVLTSVSRRTPVYCKPLVVEPDQPPRELSRLDSKNWTATPPALQLDLAAHVSTVCPGVDAVILMDQVDLPDTGVVTRPVRDAVHDALVAYPRLVVLADSRRGLGDYPPVGFKMNAAELARMSDDPEAADLTTTRHRASGLASRTGRPVFVTLADLGILAALPDGRSEYAPALPVRGPIDVVGAGDAVTANLATSLAAGADIKEALRVAMAAASIVVHQLGTTGTATVEEICGLLAP